MFKTLKKFCENKFFWAAVLAALVAVGISYGFFISSIDGFGGKYTVFLSDLYEQYSAFARYFIDSSFMEKLYSFSKGFGEQTIGLNAYYNLSPLNFILLFFKAENISLAFCVIIICKFIFMAESMYRYLCFHYKNYFVNAAFALAWAFFPTLMQNYFNVIWLEAIGLLPLLILATEMIIDGKSKKLFVITYFLSLLSSYYITLMSSVYIFFYFMYYRITKYGFDIKCLINKALKMRQSVLWAAAFSAPVVLTAFMYLLQGKFNGTEVSDWRRIKHRQLNDLVFMLFEQFFITDSRPQLIGCIGMLFALVAFLLCGKIAKRQKAAAVVFLLANTLRSIFFRFYSYIWTGFTTPLGFPFRHMFVYVFTITILARMGFEYMDKKTGCRVAAVMLPVYIFARGYYLYFDYLPWTVATVLTTGLSVMVCLAGFSNIDKYWVRMVLAVYITASVILQAGFFVQKTVQVYRPLKNVTSRQYKEMFRDVNAALSYINDDGFYRIEDTDSMVENQPLMFGYNGVSYYSSDYSIFIKEMSMHFGYPDSFYGTAYTQNQLADSFFGIKYIMSYGDLSGQYQLEYDANKDLYYNSYALPLIFTSDTSRVQYSEDAKEHINNMFKALTGISVLDSGGQTDISRLEQAAGILQENACDVTLSDGALLKFAARGKKVVSTIPYSDDWLVYVNGKRVQSYKFMDYFMAFDLDDTQPSRVTMIYMPEGMILGCAIFTSALVLAVILLIRKRKHTNG